jgi:alkylated DNA repair dioxygenase AlkB
MSSLTSKITELPEGKSWIEELTLPEDLLCSEKDFTELLAMKPSERGKVIVFNKEYDVPRWQQSFGQDYFFSGIDHKASEITHPYLLKLLSFVQKHSGKNYQQMLINWYMNGSEYISAHSDSEKQLVKNSSIYSFSFGATRDFVITSKSDKDYRLIIPLKNNTLIIMGGETQKYYKHGVPKRLKVKDPRINVTMRLYTTE